MQNLKLTFVSLIVCMLIISQNLIAQNLQNIQKDMQAAKYDKVFKSLEKISQKNPEHPGIFYLFAAYYADSLNADFNKVTAYNFTMKAINLFQKDSSFWNDQLQKSDIKINDIFELKQKLDANAFYAAQLDGRLIAYEDFVFKHPNAAQETLANSKIDSIMFEQAQKQNTYHAYQHFLQQRPASPLAPQAQTLYEKLLFHTKTKDADLPELESFVKEHPNSPFLLEVHQKILQLYAFDNEADSYLEYLKKHANSPLAPQAWWSLWAQTGHSPDFFDKYPQAGQTFHLIQDKSAKSFFALMQEGNWHFYDTEGHSLFKSPLPLADLNACQLHQWPFVSLGENLKYGLFHKSGVKFIDQTHDEIKYLGSAVAKVRQNSLYALFHITDKALTPFAFQEITPLNDQVLLVKKDNKTGLINYHGQAILETLYDSVLLSDDGKLLLFYLKGKVGYYFADLLIENIENKVQVRFDCQFDQITFLNASSALLAQNDLMTWLDLDAKKELIKDIQDYKLIEKGWAIKKDDLWNLYDFSFKKIYANSFQEILTNKRYIAFFQEDLWGVMSQQLEMLINPAYHQVKFLGDKGIYLQQKDASYAFFPKAGLIEFSKYDLVEQQRVSFDYFSEQQKITIEKFFVITQIKNKKGLIADDGNVIFQNIYDKIIPVSADLFIVEKAGKYGLLDASSKLIQPYKYELATALPQEGVALLLKQKFGLYIESENALIQPIFDQNPAFYDQGRVYLLGKQNGKFAFYSRKGMPISGFDFDEVVYYKENIALVNWQDRWQLFDIANNAPLTVTCQSYDTFQVGQKKFLKIYKSTGYGIVHPDNLKTIIAPEFTDVFLIKDEKQALFVAEKSIDQAGIVLLIYFDLNGKTLRTFNLTDKDYAAMSCFEQD